MGWTVEDLENRLSEPGFRGESPWQARTHSIEFKRQVVQESLGGDSPHALAKRHGISRDLIKIWVAKYEAGGLTATRLPRMCWPTMRRA